MYFSNAQIEQSLKRLNELNPFFGTIFLAFKEVALPIGETKNLNFLPVLEAFLQKYYRPLNRYSGFYTPFKTSNKKKRWNTHQYANTLHRIAVDTFSDVILHPKSTREWGWRIDYVETLANEHLAISLIPTFDLAVWLFRTRNWPAHTTVTGVIEIFLNEFHISERELVLFNTLPSFNPPPLFQEAVLDSEALLEIIGLPPDEQARAQENRSPTLLYLLNTLAEYGAKLQQLKLHEVGLCEEIELEPAGRLNIITGDNALGKTFLLECAWWALTDTWASKYPAYPPRNADDPSITFQIGKDDQEKKDKKQTVKYNWRKQSWPPLKNREVLPGLSLFSQADGSFAIWDPAKLEDLARPSEATEAFMRISPNEVWNGVRRNRNGKEIVLCRGLIEDWITWQESSDQTLFSHFSQALQELSPHPQNSLIPGEPTRIPDEEADVRRVPTLQFPYGTVPVLLCSAGIKRIVALAYLVVWAWNEHVVRSQSIREEPQRSIVLLIDEMEAHLHPFWQRVIVPAIMRVVQALSKEVDMQILIATHSPLVLASVEPLFDADLDKLFHLYLNYAEGVVVLDEVPFVKRGRIDQWLTSAIFGLTEPRSRDAEQVIEAAKELQLADEEPPEEQVQKISNDLKRVLAPDDEFWPLWTYYAQERGATFDAH